MNRCSKMKGYVSTYALAQTGGSTSAATTFHLQPLCGRSSRLECPFLVCVLLCGGLLVAPTVRMNCVHKLHAFQMEVTTVRYPLWEAVSQDIWCE